ncbi:hypothetical protein NDS46_31690 (plasmid) [Paenibacillus thiaminolyticus]|uniref:hypothetical protein n=1 Tax=Paenibacillus thiaminolyticus TaxID=49283 RepID=UPI00232E1DE1|nr:hypothetical protein [Paenibacillus thiaminolyticus]WCF11522.1 hypothetical protein NDS46_31690 [Paenibacillus thiaminolyticus]
MTSLVDQVRQMESEINKVIVLAKTLKEAQLRFGSHEYNLETCKDGQVRQANDDLEKFLSSKSTRDLWLMFSVYYVGMLECKPYKPKDREDYLEMKEHGIFRSEEEKIFSYYNNFVLEDQPKEQVIERLLGKTNLLAEYLKKGLLLLLQK